MKYLLTISYDGSKFNGFQRQNNVRNIQGEIENSLSDFFNEKVVIKGAGRTDRGVHATSQKAHFVTNNRIKGLKSYLNKNLQDIKIKKIEKVNNDFHARHNVISKRYIYKISQRKKDDSNYYLINKGNLNISKMRECAKLFIGTHDYRNFVSGERDNYMSTIYNIRIIRMFKRIYIIFDGIGFYRYMIRNIVGALIQVSKNKVSIDEVNDMINCNSDKRLNTALANGLYLVKIKY